jgi:hypothetical protein
MSDVRNPQQFGYHAAPDYARASIERHGLHPHMGEPLWEETEDFGSEAGHGYGRGVYMFQDKDEAFGYAKGMERMSKNQPRPEGDNLRLHEPTKFDVWEAEIDPSEIGNAIEEDPDQGTYRSFTPIHRESVRRLSE